jgi:hypothetical protein
LYEGLATFFTDPATCYEQASMTDYERGRIEVLSIKVTTAMNDYLSATWPGIKQMAQLIRTVTVRRTGKTTNERVYLIRTLSLQQASPEGLLELVPQHWYIEQTWRYEKSELADHQSATVALGEPGEVADDGKPGVCVLTHALGAVL